MNNLERISKKQYCENNNIAYKLIDADQFQNGKKATIVMPFDEVLIIDLINQSEKTKER